MKIYFLKDFFLISKTECLIAMKKAMKTVLKKKNGKLSSLKDDQMINNMNIQSALMVSLNLMFKIFKIYLQICLLIFPSKYFWCFLASFLLVHFFVKISSARRFIN